MVEAAGFRSAAQDFGFMIELVEAAGIEPDSGDNLNLLMVHEFGHYRLISIELPRRFESPGVPSCPLESPPVMEIYWRRSMKNICRIK